MTGTVKCIIGNWNLNDEVIERNLFLLSLSQRRPLPVAIEAGHCSEQNKTFHQKLIVKAGMYVEIIAKLTK